MSEQRLRERFVRLCEIPSPTGSERALADDVLSELGSLGVDVYEDNSAGPARAGAGNLIARIPGVGEDWVSFFSHMDTVPHDGPIEVELRDGVFRSAGETILGADNKAATTVLLELATEAVSSPLKSGLELVFTVAEEDGLRGAKELDVSSLRAPFGYALDHPTSIGEVVTAAPSHNRIVAEFAGKEAHSGVEPERGVSAIAAAAAAVATMELGRLDEETTTNVGVITGGSAPNVVPGGCRIEGEARSLAEAKVAAATAAMVDACTFAASERCCDVDVDVIEMFRGYRVRSSAPSVRVALEALRRCGQPAREIATGGGSDANALMHQGYECVLLANGTEHNHTPNESVAAHRLDEMLAVCRAIADLAAPNRAA